jgi:glycerophosphoryl diester phosphodiesterase
MRRAKIATLLVVVTLCVGVMVPVVTAGPASAGTNGCPPDGNFFGVAHQGAHDKSAGYRTWRNTLPAFRAAQDRCQWVESDVRFTSDMVPVMVHDRRTGPMFQDRCDLVVADHTLAELQSACRNPDGSTVATFDEYLDVVKLKGMVEIKPGSASKQELKILIGKIYAHNDADVVSLEYTGALVLERIAALDDDTNPISRVWKGAPVEYPDQVAAVCDIAIYPYRKFSPELVSRLKDLGVLSVSSVNSTSGPVRWGTLASMGAAGAATDYSLRMFDWQNGR